MESLNWASFRVKSTSFDAGLRLIREPLESPKIDLETDESEATDSESKHPEFDVCKTLTLFLEFSDPPQFQNPPPLHTP
jgi:hypothetical protein